MSNLTKVFKCETKYGSVTKTVKNCAECPLCQFADSEYGFKDECNLVNLEIEDNKYVAHFCILPDEGKLVKIALKEIKAGDVVFFEDFEYRMV
jgi:hypothetical protein